MQDLLHQFLFLHIPKTAGTSLIQYVTSVVGPEAVYQYRRGVPLLPNVVDRFKLLVGHWFLPDVRHLLESHRSFTFLRNPIDRALSAYHYYRGLSWHEAQVDADVARAQALNLEDCMAEFAKKPWSAFGNLQVAMLASRVTPNTRPEEMLEEAKTNLEALTFCGLFEQLDESVALMGSRFGWPADKTLPWLNQTTTRPQVHEVSRTARARLIEMNRLDLELYEFARHLFDERQKQQPAAASTTSLAPVRSGRRDLGAQECRISRVSLQSSSSDSAQVFNAGDDAVVDLILEASIACDSVVVGIALTDSMGATRYGVNSMLLGHELSLKPGEVHAARFTLDLHLPPGEYFLTVAVHSAEGHHYHWIDDALAFQVNSPDPSKFIGRDMCRTHYQGWTVSARTGLPDSIRDQIRIFALGHIERATVDAQRRLPVVIENLSEEWLSSTQPHPVNLSYRLLDPQTGKVVETDGRRTALLPPIPPRSRTVRQLSIDPSHKGDFMLRVTMVQEGQFWFDQDGAAYHDLLIALR
jgi:hypothetical protein